MRDKGPILKSQKIIARKRQKYLRALYVCLGIVVLVLIMPPLFVRIPWFSVKEVYVSGAKTVDQEEVKEFVMSNMSETFLKVFPKSTFLTVGRNSLKAGILEKFRTIENVSFGIKIPNTLTLDIEERNPFALWCNSGKECLFVDKGGFIYADAPNFSSPVYVVFKNDSSVKNIGDRVSDQVIFDRVNALSKGFSLYGLKIKEIAFNKNDTVDFNMEHGSLYVSLKQSDSLTLENLGSLFSDPKLSLINKNGGLTVSYIDLRFGNKLFYK